MENQKTSDCISARKSYSGSGFSLFAAGMIPVALVLILRVILHRGGLNSSPAVYENRFFLWAVQFLPMYGIGIPVGMWLISRLHSASAESRKMGKKDFFLAMVMCFPMMLGGSMLGNFMASLLSGGRSVNNVVEMVTRQDPLIILTMLVAAPVMEELLFRKFLLDHTVQYGEKPAIFFSALAFGLFHCNLYQMFYAFGIGLLFGYIYVRTRNIRYTMLMHFIINFLSSVVGAFCISFLDQELFERISSGDTQILLELMEQDPKKLISFYISMVPLMLQNFLMFILAVWGTVLLGMRKKKFVFEAAPVQMDLKGILKNCYLNPGVILFLLFCLIQTAAVLVQTCS